MMTTTYNNSDNNNQHHQAFEMQKQDKIRISVQDIEKSMLDSQKQQLYANAAQTNANLLSGKKEKKPAVTEPSTT